MGYRKEKIQEFFRVRREFKLSSHAKPRAAMSAVGPAGNGFWVFACPGRVDVKVLEKHGDSCVIFAEDTFTLTLNDL